MAFDEFDENEDTVGNRILKRAAGKLLSPQDGVLDSSEQDLQFADPSLLDQAGSPVGARIVGLAAQKHAPSRRRRPSRSGPASAPGNSATDDLSKLRLTDPAFQSDRSADELRMITEPQNFSRLPKPKSPPPNASMNPHITPETRDFSSIAVPGSTRSKGKGTDNASRYAPLIMQAMKDQGLDDRDMIDYALATIHAETGEFAPVTEGQSHYNTSRGGRPFDLYEPHTHKGDGLGNTQPGDGEKYRGRGFVQLTGRGHYADYGKRLGIDLINNPDLALDPTVSARILALYLKDRESTLREQFAQADPVEALNLYRTYLQDKDDRDTATKDALTNTSLLAARRMVNGPAPVPNGLERFLPSEMFAGQYAKQLTTAARNPDFTVGQAAALWTEADPNNAEKYIRGLESQLGVTRDTKMSALTQKQRQQLQDAQAQYAQQTVKEFEILADTKSKVQAKKRAAKAAASGQKKSGQPQSRPAQPGIGGQPLPTQQVLRPGTRSQPNSGRPPNRQP